MNTFELTVKRVKQKLIRAIVIFSIFVAIATMIGDYIVQNRIKDVVNKSRVIQNWLRGEINTIGDPNFEKIWNGIANKLISIGRNIKESRSALELKLVTALDFTREHNLKPDHKAYLTDTEVNLGMGLIMKAKDDRYKTLSIDAQDRGRFSRGLQGIYSAVNSSISDIKGGDSIKEYSNILLKRYFKVYDAAETYYPELTILWIYIASQRTGTFAAYPAPDRSLNFKFDDRIWYNTSIGEDAYTGAGDRKPGHGEQITSNPDIGLTPFYGDFVSNGFMRTLWYRFNIGDSKYVVCADVIMAAPEVMNIPGILGTFLPASSNFAGKLFNSILYGIIVGLALMLLGIAFVVFGGPWANRVGRSYIFGKSVQGESQSSRWYVVEPISKAYAKYAESVSITQGNTIHSSEKETQKSSIGLPSSYLNFEFEQQSREERSMQLTQFQTLSVPQEQKLKIRGKELWTIYKRRQRLGTCRLCDQEIAYYGEEQRIGSVEIIHRMNHEPEVDFKRKRRNVEADARSIEDNMQWHALNIDDKNYEQGTQPLEIYPTPRIPEQLSKYNFIKNLILRNRRLNEGRYVAEDLLNISTYMLEGNIVLSVHRVNHMKKLLSEPEGMANLKLGKDVKRLIIASRKEELNRFLYDYGRFITELKNNTSQKILTASFEGSTLTALDLYKELNFSILTFQDKTDVVIVSSPEVWNKGYVSWREADVLYFLALFKQLEDIASEPQIEGRNKNQKESPSELRKD